MLDLKNIEKYKENNRIEAKKATGGLPKSIWETYSAFANTLGGVILLGVEEYADKSLHPVDLPDPEWILSDFWDIINDPRKVSSNILSENDVRIHDADGKRIIVISVPRADRCDKPVFIDGDPLTGSYRRNGEGDYKCSRDEVHAMLRDAARVTQDMKILENRDASVFDLNTLSRYRDRLRSVCPDDELCILDDESLLLSVGAMAKGKDGKLHPTAAGLLMFGRLHHILREYPYFSLDYREEIPDPNGRILSGSGDWSGNVFDFFCRVYDRIADDVHIPFNVSRSGDTPVQSAIREALLNCIINADYYSRKGLVITKKPDSITFSNPGGFRIDLDSAKLGGVSDPRNAGLIRIFSFAGIGRRMGSGFAGILSVWDKNGLAAPVIREEFGPERITLSLSVIPDNHCADTCDKQKEAIIEYLTDNISASPALIARLLGVKLSAARSIISQLEIDGFIVAGDDGCYSLKA